MESAITGNRWKSKYIHVVEGLRQQWTEGLRYDTVKSLFAHSRRSIEGINYTKILRVNLSIL